MALTGLRGAAPQGERAGCYMEEVFRTNDLVKLSYVEHLLNEAGITYFVADQHISAVEGNIGAFPRRVMVHVDHVSRAQYALKDVEPG